MSIVIDSHNHVGSRPGMAQSGRELVDRMHGYRLGDHRLVDPLLAAACDLGIVVTCHGVSDLNNSPLEFAEAARAFPDIALLMRGPTSP